ncbi:hypothetical protein E4T49_04880 [Aureobasidium sp. EXF-10728]|nr:hypothetical protein E4T49_04880 [Aureobasidium sp. EXF-10728]
MSATQRQQTIFRQEQYFWCHEGNERIENWLSDNKQDHPHIYATYINDANAAVYRKPVGKSVEHDKRMLAFLEKYPMTYTDIIDESAWYKTNILQKKDWSGVGPHKTGLIDVFTYKRDLLYKQVFDHETRHQHWIQRGEQGLLNSDETEPLSKKQKSHLKSQARWHRMDEVNARLEARGITDKDIDPSLFAEGPHGVHSTKYAQRLLLDLEVGEKKECQSKAQDDTGME